MARTQAHQNLRAERATPGESSHEARPDPANKPDAAAVAPTESKAVHPLQTALRETIAARDAIKKHSVTVLYVQQSDLQLRATALEAEVASARGRLKLASDDETADAKASYEKVSSDFSLCHLRLEGIAEKVVIAEAALAAAERAVSRAESELAIHIAGTEIEPPALVIARELGKLRRRRLLLARIAARAATDASGMASDPMGGIEGDRTDWSREIDDLFAARDSEETITTQDLLDWPLRTEAAATA